MCGTSHDGLDIADVMFVQDASGWSFSLEHCYTASLPENLTDQLDRVFELSGFELMQLDRDFAVFCAKEVEGFRKAHDSQAAFIASHGVTAFHQSENHLSVQLGSGAVIAALTGLTCISDFRQQDVSKGGQGAPLVPLADSYLFIDYDYTLNLGGFANLCALKGPQLFGFDIAPCNLVLNSLAHRQGQSFDKGGQIAAMGNVLPALLEQLNALEFYQRSAPKSLGVEWLVEHFQPLIPGGSASPNDLMATCAEHIAIQIGHTLSAVNASCLVTGGGVYNTHLIDRVRHYSTSTIEVPSQKIIDYKEAIDFAFLGLLRLMEQVNIDRSVTGATTDSIGGAVYLP